MRIDKFLSHQGFGSRRDVKELLKKRVVTVNGALCKNAGLLINPEKDVVCVAEQPVVYHAFVYYLVNKPTGVLSATKDASQKTVLSLFTEQDFRRDIFPVGRLDKDTTGLLLVTNDGHLAHQLLTPKNRIAKTYTATVTGEIDERICQQFKAGMTLANGEECAPASLEILSVSAVKNLTEVRLTINEGKYHQVKRMFGAIGERVVRLERVRFGSLQLPTDLARGSYRQLTTAEIEQLRELVSH